MTRWTALVLALLVAAITAYVLRAEIAMRVLRYGLDSAMSSDSIEDLGPGIHVILCGAGGPMPDPARSGPCVAVVAGSRLFVVDSGTGGARNLARFGYPLGNIDAVFLTHFHSDHIDGLGETALLRWVNGGNTSPLPVIGPEGVSRVVAGFNEAYAQDSVYRTAHHGDAVTPESASGMIAVTHEIPGIGESRLVYENHGVRVEMIRVDHSPVTPAVGYLFKHRGRQVLISGDTDKSSNLHDFAEGVDLLVHEALAPHMVGVMRDAAEAAGNAGLVRIFDDILEYHTTPIEAAEIARDANVGQLLYYHIVPALLVPGSEAAWLQGVDEVFSDYTLGRDGTTISLSPVTGK